MSCGVGCLTRIVPGHLHNRELDNNLYLVQNSGKNGAAAGEIFVSARLRKKSAEDIFCSIIERIISQGAFHDTHPSRAVSPLALPCSTCFYARQRVVRPFPLNDNGSPPFRRAFF
jgi:hypothetical protein